MKELNLEQMENTQGGKFWGVSCTPDGEEYLCMGGGGLECCQDYKCKKQIFWIKVREGIAIGGCKPL